METRYLRTRKRHVESLAVLLRGIQSGSIYSLKLRLAYLDQLSATFETLGVGTHDRKIRFLKNIYQNRQTRHFFLIVDETSQFIYHFKHVQDFLRILIAQIQFGDILSIFSFDECIKVRHTHRVQEAAEESIEQVRKRLNYEFNEKLDQMRRSKMLDRKDVYANLQEILIPFLTMELDGVSFNLDTCPNSEVCGNISLAEFRRLKRLNNYVFLFLFEGTNFEKNQKRKSQIKAMMNSFSKLSKNNNLQVCFEKTFVNFMLLKPCNTTSIQDKILNIIKASKSYFVVFYNQYVQNKVYVSKIELILKSFII